MNLIHPTQYSSRDTEWDPEACTEIDQPVNFPSSHDAEGSGMQTAFTFRELKAK